ncbi:MAG: 1-acyl-sn-glycerol-3-phosphate acyltransferase [Candidatus Competibacteraceae bacterium]|nr:1-acyl-sn-glycerol-3-phosphate acyltransferase [Candidatus Competibacteraceae bacterium]
MLDSKREVPCNGTPHAGDTLFVANHISWLDIFCIAAVCPTHFLAKRDVAAWPLFGWLCRRAGTAFIQRGRSDGATEAIEQLVWRLRRGERVLVFPEGTSTIGESVRRFHPRLFSGAAGPLLGAGHRFALSPCARNQPRRAFCR